VINLESINPGGLR